MADTDKKEDVTDVDTDVKTDVDDSQDVTEDDPANDVQDTEEEGDSEDITYEQALEWKKKAERAEKAERKIVEMKKKEKLTPKAPDQDVRAILAEEKFYDKNSEAEPYREKIEDYHKRGIDRTEALWLVSKKDKEIEANREVYGGSMVGDGETESVVLVSVEQFDKFTETQQNEYTEKVGSKYGGIRFK